MAIKSTVLKAHVTITDIGRGYYQDHELTLARHPSETDVRVLPLISAASKQPSILP